jgi:hypothetical protein
MTTQPSASTEFLVDPEKFERHWLYPNTLRSGSEKYLYRWLFLRAWLRLNHPLIEPKVPGEALGVKRSLWRNLVREVSNMRQALVESNPQKFELADLKVQRDAEALARHLDYRARERSRLEGAKGWATRLANEAEQRAKAAEREANDREEICARVAELVREQPKITRIAEVLQELGDTGYPWKKVKGWIKDKFPNLKARQGRLPNKSPR